MCDLQYTAEKKPMAMRDLGSGQWTKKFRSYVNSSWALHDYLAMQDHEIEKEKADALKLYIRHDTKN